MTPRGSQAEATIVLLWIGDFSPKVRWTFGTLVVGMWLGFAAALRERVIHPLQTLSNMLAALREGDFTIRGRSTSREDPLGLAFFEANTLSETLRQQRLGALEASALLRRVMEEIDAAVFTFDSTRAPPAAPDASSPAAANSAKPACPISCWCWPM